MHSLLWSSPAYILWPVLCQLLSYPKLHSDMVKSLHSYGFVKTRQRKFGSLGPGQPRLTSRLGLDSCHRMMQSLWTVHYDSKAQLQHKQESQTGWKLGLSTQSNEARAPQASAGKEANNCSWFQVGNTICVSPKAQGVAAFLLQKPC